MAQAERAVLRHGLRSPHAFTLRRCPILLPSDQGPRPSPIAAALGCATQTVRDALRAFATEGLGCLHTKPKTPHPLRTAWPKDHDQDLRALLPPSPRALGKATSWWTLPVVALVCHEKGWTPRRLSGETIRRVLKRLGVPWKRAQHGLTSPDPEHTRKKPSATG